MVVGQLHQRQDGYLRLIRHEDEEDRSFEKKGKGRIYIYMYIYIFIYICAAIYTLFIYIYILHIHIYIHVEKGPYKPMCRDCAIFLLYLEHLVFGCTPGTNGNCENSLRMSPSCHTLQIISRLNIILAGPTKTI